jgi:hypothetical protein
MSLTSCYECGRRRSTSSSHCPHCGSRRNENNAAVLVDAAAGTVAVVGAVAVMDWPDRCLFFTTVLSIGGAAAHYTDKDVWAAWFAYGLVGIVIGLFLCMIRVVLGFIIGDKRAWCVFLPALSAALYRYGPGFLEWIQRSVTKQH